MGFLVTSLPEGAKLPSAVKTSDLVAALVALTVIGAFGQTRVAAQEAVAEEVRVEASFAASTFELRRDKAVQLLTDRLVLRADEIHAAELQHANENSVSRLLELTKYVPIPLGSSENRVDTFFLSNYMRSDLNPREDKRLFGKR
jgi:hypothetical protein